MIPHIKNSKAGRNRYEPLYKNLYEVYFVLPAAIKGNFASEEALLTEQVIKISGFDNLTKTPDTVTQTFMGTTRTYLGGGIKDTSAEITMSLSLNLLKATDNYVFKVFKAWNNLGYNLQTGEKALKNDYVADMLRTIVYSRAGDIWREVIFYDVMLTKVTGLDELDYTSTDDIATLEVSFISDWADDKLA